MIFLADIFTDGLSYKRTNKIQTESSSNKKTKKKASKKNKKKSTKQKKSTLTKLVNKTAGVASFTQGEMAIVRSMVVNDVKAPLNTPEKGRQKTIGSKKDIKTHRSI